jgi:hypothetical protein
MKKIAAVLAAVLLPFSTYAAAATWSVTDTGVKGVCASGTCDAPSAAADGIGLVSPGGWASKGVVVTVCADSGQTLSGAGTLTAWGRDPSVLLWAANPDLNLSPNTASVRCQSFSALFVAVPNGRFAWVPTGVTVSSGGVTIYITLA